MSWITCVPLLPTIPKTVADASVPMLAFNRSPKPWAFRLDLCLVFISYSWNKTRGERGSQYSKPCALAEGKLSFGFTLYRMSTDVLIAWLYYPFWLKSDACHCRVDLWSAHQGRGSTGAHHVPAAWWRPCRPWSCLTWPCVFSQIALELQSSMRTLCPGMYLNQKNYFFVPISDIKSKVEVQCQHQAASVPLGLLTC